MNNTGIDDAAMVGISTLSRLRGLRLGRMLISGATLHELASLRGLHGLYLHEETLQNESLSCLGRAIGRVDPLLHRVSTVYDVASQTIARINGLGNRWSTIWDKAGRAVVSRLRRVSRR